MNRILYSILLNVIFLLASILTACGSKPLAKAQFDRLPAGEVNLGYKKDQIEDLNFEYLEVEGLKYTKKMVLNKNLLLIVHASDLTDPKKLIKNNLKALSDYTAQAGWPQLQLAMADELNVKKTDIYTLPPTALFPFEGDSHRISHAGGNLILVGGNFTRCLCTALQSYLALARATDSKSTVYLVADAIYEGFFADTKANQADQQLLSNLTDSLTDSQFIDFLSYRFIGESGALCPDYYPIVFLKNPARAYKFTIERNGRVLAVKGTGQHEVRLIFLKTTDVISP